MFIKFFIVHKRAACSHHHVAQNTAPAKAEVGNDSSSALRIVHAGGKVECYYMAIPAARIIEKYPSFLLTRPEVFREPWNSVVRPDEILTPGQKYLVVPRHTVRKLRRRIWKPSKEVSLTSFSSSSILNPVSRASSSFSGGTMKNSSVGKKHVTFAGIGVEDKGASSKRKKKGMEVRKRAEISKAQSLGEKSRIRTLVTWRQSLTAINEGHGNHE
ncbi:putative Nucleotide-diphospho-sugar transferase family protein [Quillaja saponaria]|uniref:Nucleotide-diphospho-sugar transferase family protein n=1 Tax=Quillaja saponaria TaxID=32244 RepID=A0AAD7PMK5_QUISA|nr:putative Nucleotide-diphospho-sugar transferase family protein [Quillaja saponaria]